MEHCVEKNVLNKLRYNIVGKKKVEQCPPLKECRFGYLPNLTMLVSFGQITNGLSPLSILSMSDCRR